MLNDPNAVVPKYDDEVGPLIREAGKKRETCERWTAGAAAFGDDSVLDSKSSRFRE